jgi:hypothetical protein
MRHLAYLEVELLLDSRSVRAREESRAVCDTFDGNARAIVALDARRVSSVFITNVT